METENTENVAQKKSSLILWIAVFLLVVCVSAFVGYKFLLGAEVSLENKDAPVAKAPEIVAPVKEEIQHSDLQFGQITAPKVEPQEIDATEKITQDLSKEIEQEALAEKELQEKAAAEIAAFEPKIIALEKQNQDLLMFMAAQNISNAYNAGDEKLLQRELDFFMEIAASEPRFKGKIDLLRYSLEGGLSSAEELANELDAIAKSIEDAEEKTFWQNLQDSIFGLVKVTKLDENAEGDYPKVLLAKKALKEKDFNEAIRLVDAIDKRHTKAWLDKAYKHERVQETIAYLMEMTRKKLVQ